jgi:hypothetical protein
MVEGIEADDYGISRSLISLIKVDKKHARTRAEVPSGYEDFSFSFVRYDREIFAAGSFQSIALKIAEDHVTAWAMHAAIHASQKALL